MPAQTPKRRPIRRRPKLDRPNPVDVHVGARVRLRRTLLGLSQQSLGMRIGLTFQQVQKYERGANRIGASRLWELANVLDVPVQFFFGDMSDATIEAVKQIVVGDGGASPPPTQPDDADPLARREVLELVRAYCRIVDPTVRHRFFELAKTLAASFVDGPEPPAAKA
jgi:transcriptional regulator with XRE-family HTH domain